MPEKPDLGEKHSIYALARGLERFLMPRIRWRLTAATGEQLCDVSCIERVTLVAELTINHYRTALLGHQILGIFQPKADQGITRALTRAAAAKAQGIGLEQAQGLFVIQAVQ